MATLNTRLLRWVYWPLLAIFLIVTVTIDRQWLPHGHWSSNFLYFIPIALAQMCNALILKRLRLSPKAYPLETWPNLRHGEAVPANLEYEIRFPPSLTLFCGALCAVLVACLLCLYLFVPPSQQMGRELALPILGVFVVMGIFMVSYFSRAVIRVDSHGISGVDSQTGASSQPIAWSDITACRWEEQHDAYGDITSYNIMVLGRMERVLATYSISNDTPVEERVRLCEILRQVLTKS